MKIISKDLQHCPICNNYRGIVKEKYNGDVSVHCACDLKKQINKYEKYKSPSMVCPDGKNIWWTPTTINIESDGEKSNNPYFLGPKMNRIENKKINLL